MFISLTPLLLRIESISHYRSSTRDQETCFRSEIENFFVCLLAIPSEPFVSFRSLSVLYWEESKKEGKTKNNNGGAIMKNKETSHYVHLYIVACSGLCLDT